MMLPTHALLGAVIGSSMLFIAPEYSPFALAGAVMGSILPDLDILYKHRKTLHYPLYFSIIAAFSIIATVLYPAQETVLTAFFFIGAAVHSLSDIFGGDLGMRPWLRNDDRGVYYHYRGEWIYPRRWVPYDGSPQDFILTVLLAAPLIYLYDGLVQQLVLVTVGAAFFYMLIRKKIIEYAPKRFQ